MRLRQKRGGTLALVVAATITLILLGIAFFFLSQIFGGERELQHATDSGNLNVAKNALRRPDIRLSGEELETFGQLGDRGLINNADPPASPPVNLLSYNRLVAQAMLAALNAAKSTNDNNDAIKNANKLVDLLQTGSGSIGGRLSDALSSQNSDNPLFADFSDTAGKNSLRMLGKDSTIGHKNDEFTVSFLEQTNNDIGATNLEVRPSVRGLFSTALQASLFTVKGGKTYLRGYNHPNIGANIKTPVGVPLQPGDQPHLVSNKTFDSQKNRGSTFLTAMVPPNGFRSKSEAGEARTAAQAVTISCAEVGSLNLQFDLSAPYGYVKIVNGPDTGSGSASVPGPFVGLNHVLNNELLTGIHVAGPVFSTNKDLMDKWAAYNKEKKAGGNPSPPSGGTTGLYNLQGKPATTADAENIPFTTDDQSGAVIADSTKCTDANSTGWSRSDSDVVPQCWDLLGNGTGPGAFDAAYHPNAQYTDGSAGATDLIAVECAKCQLQHKFNTCGDLSINSGNCNQTGMRIPAPGLNWKTGAAPSGSMGTCKISQSGTVKELGNFVQDGFGDQLEDFIAERATQINPQTGDSEVRALLSSNKLNLGDIVYIYVPKPDSQNAADKKFIWSKTIPSWAVAGTTPDGKEVTASSTYNIVNTAVNPKHDGGIHDIMYRSHPNDGINGTDTAIWTPSTGFQNLLGKVQFHNSAAGYASGFCKPD